MNNEEIFCPDDIKRMLELSDSAKSLEPIISEVNGDCKALKKIKEIVESARRNKIRWENNRLSMEDYLYSKDLDYYREELRRMDSELSRVHEVWKECKKKKLETDLIKVWKRSIELETRFKEEMEKNEAGSKERNEAYGYIVYLQGIFKDIKKVRSGKGDSRLVLGIFSTFKRCVEYENLINGVLF